MHVCPWNLMSSFSEFDKKELLLLSCPLYSRKDILF